MTHPGQITWQQIPVMTKMAVGARNAVTYGEAGLQFKVGGRMRTIQVELDPTDTYTVRLVRVTRNYERVVMSEVSGVYVEQLAETIYRACH